MDKTTNSNLKYLQQGDVLIIPCDIPNEAKEIKGNILQEGEHTGHAHRLFDGSHAMYYDENAAVKYFKVITPVTLKHEEHHAFEIPPGEYRVGIVKEYDPFEKLTRDVMD